MKINGTPTRAIWRQAPAAATTALPHVVVIDQTRLPHALETVALRTLSEAAAAIADMTVRGAPLIGATAAYGVALAMQTGDATDGSLHEALTCLGRTRPTAVNLHWALERMKQRLMPLSPHERVAAAWHEAEAIADEDVAQNLAIGEAGLGVLKGLVPRDGKTLHIMTHCNAGWLATVDRGTALAPVYAAYEDGMDVHVWVSETRPRNQGLLTEWELRQHGVPHTFLCDNAAGLLLRQGKIDAVIVGADRVAANGDVANKIGTYLKALAAADNQVPFYVAAPGSTLDFVCPDGNAIPIEQRSGDEVRLIQGQDTAARLLPDTVAVSNYGFDVTPARLIKAIFTERGALDPRALAVAYPERA